MEKQKNKQLLDSFVAFCDENKELRFWQALRAWSGVHCIGVCSDVSKSIEYVDTYYSNHQDGK